MTSPAIRPPPPPASATATPPYRTRPRTSPAQRSRSQPDNILIQPTTHRKIRPAGQPPTLSCTPAPADATSLPPQVPPHFPAFPPPNVSLHKDDASNKVFLAIGRSFLSVDNRAMTIKDLSEMTIKFGLICQNVSAAGQAITTFIRNHMQRCEQEQDHPLLSRHILSGTPSDDDLVPALHSRSGGAHCALPPGDKRVTNFRRGTMVWYLSRAAGAPCPFARAGIRLAEYTEDGKLGCPGAGGPRERKRERDRRRRLLAAQQQQQCGQKRKRLARGCKAELRVDSDDEEMQQFRQEQQQQQSLPSYMAYDDDDDSTDQSEAEARPPKVKLTLRLRPSLASSSSSPAPVPAPTPSPTPMDEDDAQSTSSESSEEDSDEEDMSIDSDAASPSLLAFSSPPPSVFFRMPSPSSFVPQHHYHRSPSVASLPPDSEDEEEGHGYVTMDYEDEEEMEWSEDESSDEEENEQDTTRQTVVVVKQEPVDEDAIGGLLQAWDSRDRGVESRRVLEVVAAAASPPALLSHSPPSLSLVSPPQVKREELDAWDFGAFLPPRRGDDVVAVDVPRRDDEAVLLSPVGEAPVAVGRRKSELMWQDAEILGLETISQKELDEGWDVSSSSLLGRTPSPPPPALSSSSSSSPSPLSPPPPPPPSLSPMVNCAPSPEAESEEDALGPCTPPSSVPVAPPPKVWASEVVVVSSKVRFEPDGEEAPITWTEVGSDDEGCGHGLRDLWDAEELRRCVGPSTSEGEDDVDQQQPLSPTEEAMFHVLCDLSDFEPRKEEEGRGEGEKENEERVKEEVEKPLALRRSRRVQEQQSARKVQAAGTGGQARRRRGVGGTRR